MSANMRERTTLRPSLKKYPIETLTRGKDSDPKRRVTFATPKLPSLKCSVSGRRQNIDPKNVAKVYKHMRTADVNRKRIPSAQLEELCAKKNKHNEQIVRLYGARNALVQSEYAIKGLSESAEQLENDADTLMVESMTLMETCVLRRMEEYEFSKYLDDIEEQQNNHAQEKNEEFAALDETVNLVNEVAEKIEKYNEMLDARMQARKVECENEELTVVQQMRMLSEDAEMYLLILEDLKHLHL